METRIKIKHPGKRMWAGIAASAFDPAVHEIYEGNEEPVIKAGEGFTRESIASMKKKDVIELLKAHGADPDGRWSVGRLRDELIAIMFVDA